MQVHESRKKLFHDAGSFALTQVFPLNNEVEQFTTIAIFQDEEADVIPFPDLVQLDDIWVILKDE